MKHLIEIITELEGKGVGFRSITENIDTTTSGGRLVFHLFGALAQFERDLIRERTRADLQAAEERGRRGGRQALVTPDKLAKARQHLAAGLNVREAAARVKVGKSALYEALKAEKSTASNLSRMQPSVGTK
jgi:DNA invertase Pin-like site-specific DNA recombinase